ncbi:hypothetical protein [Sporosarcina sp. Marseille-Q4943]|uniref:hypothetical protein n=1 Tax=Sporosarcina sp. Marseille-Q4943 TaxID=2942204 RepID=UPI00208DA3D7|nr:hypothetical protein [Sporosarcina sp. Marseille-Q4943]
MPKVQYKHKTGALHIGGGRFFYANDPVEVEDNEVEGLLASYADLELVEGEELPQDPPQDDVPYTASSLKKLNKAEQEELIVLLEGDLETVKNEEERIALILTLQEEKEAETE